MQLEGKRILITAAGQGIGRASALACAAEGALVIATDRDRAMLVDLRAFDTRELDLTDGAAIQSLTDEIAPLDDLFNCAGVVHADTALSARDADWDFAFLLNVTAMMRAIRAFLPGMLARAQAEGTASIVIMASMASSVKGFADRTTYGTSKAVARPTS